MKQPIFNTEFTEVTEQAKHVAGGWWLGAGQIALPDPLFPARNFSALSVSSVLKSFRGRTTQQTARNRYSKFPLGSHALRKSNRPLILASRTSRLARIQTETVARMLAQSDPSLRIEFRWIESEADQKPDLPLSSAGGKGLFVRRVEKMLLDHEADLAVHSLKDLPVAAAPELNIAAIPRRADVRDVLISSAGYPSIHQLPQGAKIGTASARRKAQLLALRPDLVVELLRGNVDTRLRAALDEKRFDAIVLAHAGLQRLGLMPAAPQAVVLDVNDMLPPAGQGALALQCRTGDHVTLRRCLPLNHAVSATLVHAERQVVAGLGGDCHSAMGVLAEWVTAEEANQPTTSRQDHGQPWVRLRVRVLSAEGREKVESDDQTPARHVGKFIKRVVKDLQARGAGRLMGT